MNQRFLAVLLSSSLATLSACGGQVMMPDDDGGTGGADATGGTGGTETGGHGGTGATGGYAGTGAMGGYAGTGAMGGYAGTGAMGGYAGTGAMGGYAGTGAMGGYAGGPPNCSATQDCFGCCASAYISQMAYVNKLWFGCGGCSDFCSGECEIQLCQDPTMIPYDDCRICYMDSMQQSCMSELVSCLNDASCAPIIQCWLGCQ